MQPYYCLFSCCIAKGIPCIFLVISSIADCTIGGLCSIANTQWGFNVLLCSPENRFVSIGYSFSLRNTSRLWGGWRYRQLDVGMRISGFAKIENDLHIVISLWFFYYCKFCKICKFGKFRVSLHWHQINILFKNHCISESEALVSIALRSGKGA